MNRGMRVLVVVSMIIGGVIASGLFAHTARSMSLQAANRRTVFDGVYTTEQASRGETVYKNTCVNCHGEELLGGGGGSARPLKTGEFIDRWREDNLQSLFDVLKTTMPRNAPGSLNEAEYLAIMAYVLQTNGFPPGSAELARTALGGVQLTGKDGPKPLPNNSQVLAVGCLTPGTGDNWTLTNVAEPGRTRKPTETTPEELKASATMPLGTQTFQLRNLDFLDPVFDPAPHKGHKMQVKGAVLRQGNNSRITVTSVEMVAATCAP